MSDDLVREHVKTIFRRREQRSGAMVAQYHVMLADACRPICVLYEGTREAMQAEVEKAKADGRMLAWHLFEKQQWSVDPHSVRAIGPANNPALFMQTFTKTNSRF